MTNISRLGRCLFAIALWLFAATKVLSIAYSTLDEVTGNIYWWQIGSFIFFSLLVFPRAVKPNVAYILQYERKSLLHCMRPKTWLIMIFMITLGISVRKFSLASPEFICGFYTGLGVSLLGCIRFYLRPVYQLIKGEI